MIESKTLLILGAGASVPYGYPTGLQLRKELHDSNNLKALENGKYHQEAYLFCQHFELSQLFSIDAFLAKRGEGQIGNSNGVISSDYQNFGTYAEFGKLAIAFCLIKRERACHIIPTDDPREDHWLEYLWNHMSDGPKEDFKNNQLKIISFNYDRVVERFFQTTIEHTYGTDSQEASELSKSIEIIHVYGNLQDLNEMAYGEKPEDLASVAKCIRVIPEARNENDTQFEKAKKFIDWAEKICFIGFGFDSTNMRRLGFPNHDLSGKKIRGTVYGMKAPEVKAAENLLGAKFFNSDNYTNLKTLEYAHHLTAFCSY